MKLLAVLLFKIILHPEGLNGTHFWRQYTFKGTASPEMCARWAQRYVI